MNYSVRKIAAMDQGLSLVPTGRNFYRGNGMFNVKGGEAILWNEDTGKTIAPADLCNTRRARLAIGTGPLGQYSKNPPLFIGSDAFNICEDNFKVTFSNPTCSRSGIAKVDIGCVDTYSALGLDIVLRSPTLQQYYGGDGTHRFNFQYAHGVDSSDCVDCVPKAKCFEILCGLARKINERNGTIESCVGEWDNSLITELPIKAAVVPEGKTPLKFCLKKEDTACKTCNVYKELTEVSVTGKLWNSTSEAFEDVTKTLDDLDILLDSDGNIPLGNMEMFETMLNDFLKEFNSVAKINEGATGCCPTEIIVMGCFDSFSMSTADGEITPCPIDVWQPYTKESECLGCEVAPNVIDPGCQLLIMGDTRRRPCGCDGLGGDELNFDTTVTEILDIQFTGDDWRGNYRWEMVQEAYNGTGFGIDWIDAALLKQHAGGSGQFKFYGGEKYGMNGSRMNNMQFFDAQNNVFCHKTYCSINVIITKNRTVDQINAKTFTNRELYQIPIEINSTASHDAMKSLFETLANCGNCNMVGEGCGSDDTSGCCEEAPVEPPQV